MNKNASLYAVLLCFAIFNISIQIFMPYLILYYTEALKMENYVLIMAPAILLASVFTFFYGRVYDRIGFAKSAYASLALLLSGYAGLFLFKATALVFIGSLLMMCGPVCGLVQVPCIERNAIAAARALDANTYAMLSDGQHLVTFDKVVRVMKETGLDLPSLYRETSEGGLAKRYYDQC